ncbi:GNAT superfamily N-acetyltransferase [Bradyrhizobium sp. USDA 4341]
MLLDNVESCGSSETSPRTTTLSNAAAYYEDLIAKGRMTVCLHDGIVANAEPGDVTLLFISPELVGLGLGGRLLEIGIAQARVGHSGSIWLEATINAEGFTQSMALEVWAEALSLMVSAASLSRSSTWNCEPGAFRCEYNEQDAAAALCRAGSRLIVESTTAR